MPIERCPRCREKFKSYHAVTAHLSQPLGSCYSYTRELTTLYEELGQLHTQRRAENSVHDDSAHPEADDDTMDCRDEFKNMEDRNLGDMNDPSGPFVEEYANASKIHGQGTTFFDTFNKDPHARKRINNLFYPFASKDEWELASFLLESNMSMAAIDSFLSLTLIKQLDLSFHTSKRLRSLAEMLPSGPEWKCQLWQPRSPTKSKIQLFYRNPLECIQAILQNPLFADHLQFKPLRVFETAEKITRIYTEWLTGDVAWSMQDQLPAGATILGTILSSDKTNISSMTGGRMAHPLLLSLANLNMAFRTKASNNAFLLLALLPIPKFIHTNSKIRGVLENRLIHECLDFILEPLKTAARIGIMMSDPFGNLRYFFPILAAYIVDTPEAAMLAGVAGKTSSVTIATYKQFGDPFPHEPRTASTTLAQLAVLEEMANPWDLEAYTKLALEKFRLNGIHRPFFRDWALADPSLFLTPEPLHHWHRMFWDHDAKWCIHVVGSSELDFRFTILPPHTGFRHFNEGISKLKQVTGRDHRDIQRYIIGVIAGAVPRKFLIAIRALQDFRYLAQAPVITDEGCQKIRTALLEFHNHKDAIVAAGARTGKRKGVKAWGIPKLEFMQSVVRNIQGNGASIQWSADVTERAHITEIKNPSESVNNQNYEAQICRYLDREDKRQRFDLATTILTRIRCSNFEVGENDSDSDGDHQPHLSSDTNPVSKTTTRRGKNYFKLSDELQQGSHPRAPQPFRTFVNAKTAMHLNRDPSFQQMTVEQAVTKYNILDLRPAIIDYISHQSGQAVGGRRVANRDTPLPFNFKALQVWTKLRLQNYAYHPPHEILPAQTINAFPPSDLWPLGHSDAVILNTDPVKIWPQSGLEGHQIVQLRLIFHIVSSGSHPVLSGRDHFLAYVQRFDIIPQLNPKISPQKGPYPDPATSMFVLKRARRSDQTVIGDVVPVSRIRCLVDLIPRFRTTANPKLSKENVMEYSTEFFLNHYLDKETFFALH